MLVNSNKKNGSRGGPRSPNPSGNNRKLYQLSYSGTESGVPDWDRTNDRKLRRLLL